MRRRSRVALASFCAAGPKRAACEAAVAAAAPDDASLYQMVSEAFEAQMAPLRREPGFAQRMALHRAAVHALNSWTVD